MVRATAVKHRQVVGVDFYNLIRGMIHLTRHEAVDEILCSQTLIIPQRIRTIDFRFVKQRPYPCVAEAIKGGPDVTSNSPAQEISRAIILINPNNST